MASSDLVPQLKRQLIFLRNSASSYDEGHTEEAVRIAVVIRVLCHDTKQSVSLLEHMGQKTTLKLATTAKTVPSHILAAADFAELLAGTTFGQTISYNPVSADSPTILCSDWWAQPIFFRDKILLTRRDVVLSAANKDGGAHVDAPDAKLLALQEGFWLQTSTNSDGSTTTLPLLNNHFRMLRRLADELLNSQELLKLTKK